MSGNLDTFDRTSIRKYALDTFGYSAFQNNIEKVYNDVIETGKSKG